MPDILETTEDGRFRIVIEQDTDADPSDRQGAGYVYFLEFNRPRVPFTVADEYDKAGAANVRDQLARALETFPGDLDTVSRYFRTIGCAVDYFDTRDGRYVGITTPELAQEWGCDSPDVDLSEWQARADGEVYGYVIEEQATWTSNTIGGPREMTTWETVDYSDGALWGLYGREYAEETAREAWSHFLDTVTISDLSGGDGVTSAAGPVWFVWHGGSSYSMPSWSENLETAGTVEDVLEVLEDRRHNRDGQTPCVDETSGAHVFYADPTGSEDPYPDLVVDMVGGEYATSPA